MEHVKTIIIENVYPELDSGRYPVKRVVGESVEVWADILKEGHDILTAYVLYRVKGEETWQRAPMKHIDNDRWMGAFTLTKNARWEYTIRAFGNTYQSWVEEITKKLEANVTVSSELKEGLKLIEQAVKRAENPDDKALFAEYLKKTDHAKTNASKVKITTSAGVADLMARYPDESLACNYDRILELMADRKRARFASWYEFFPRSSSPEPGKHGTFKDAADQLPAIADMGYDVVYFPPIHPIGHVNRKGKNNTLTPEPGDVGSPYAIGSAEGGYYDVHPELGTLDDFDELVDACHALDMEIALDFAIQCAPDNPYVKEHPEWFFKRPDGTIKFAENPPKKYEDIYPLNFYCENYKTLWEEMYNIIEFWIKHGVRIFRIDNPHTKPILFWQWLITKVQDAYPSTLFLAEAFTRPKIMRALGKAGFTQSYTYFTWRNAKHEIMDYFEELTQGPMREYFRGNLFPTTPDILPTMLQEGGKPAFEMRAVLAATLSSLLGCYSGYELCENAALPGREEFLDSEKYEIRQRNFDTPDSIAPLLSNLNYIRRENPALQEYDNLRFYDADNEQILFYGKATKDASNCILVVVSLDPYDQQRSIIHVPLADLKIKPDETYQMHDLLSGRRLLWQGEKNSIELGPATQMAHVFEVRRWIKHENDFDYF